MQGTDLCRHLDCMRADAPCAGLPQDKYFSGVGACVGKGAVLRISFGTFLFFAVHFVALLGGLDVRNAAGKLDRSLSARPGCSMTAGIAGIRDSAHATSRIDRHESDHSSPVRSGPVQHTSL